MTTKTAAPKKKRAPRKAPSQAELKRQLAALKQQVKSQAAELEAAKTPQTMPSSTEQIIIQGTDARQRPVINQFDDDYEAQEVGQGHPRELRSTGDSSEALDRFEVDTVDKAIPADKMAELAFAEEKILVRVHETTDETAMPIPCVQNDGRSQYFVRGQDQWVKRKFVEILARCKITTYTQEMYKDGAGNDGYRQIPHTTLMYPFSVMQDKNKRGSEWLNNILMEG